MQDPVAARVRGRPVAGDGRGAHLDVATDPARVAGLLGWAAGLGCRAELGRRLAGRPRLR
ncbi:hypothetical protein ACI79Z_19840 [Geodermatophilus sp. SYSU D00663]